MPRNFPGASARETILTTAFGVNVVALVAAIYIEHIWFWIFSIVLSITILAFRYRWRDHFPDNDQLRK